MNTNTETPQEPPRDATAPLPPSIRRHAALIVVAVLGLTFVGFLRGIREPAPLSAEPESAAKPRDEKIPEARRYSEAFALRALRDPPKTSLIDAKEGAPTLLTPVVRTEEMTKAALIDRARNRAYDGAPPTMTHPIDNMTTATCMFCHEKGLQAGDRVATKMSHPFYSNCVQCHIGPAVPAFAEFASPMPSNDFLGAGRSGRGSRASPGAPPTIPHTTWLRQDCMSCHGLVARPGLRTTHPWLSNCTQCHAESGIQHPLGKPQP